MHTSCLSWNFPTIYFPGCFFGDPHIVTLDGGSYTFNGCGEYTMVLVEEMDYELQGRTDNALVNGTITEGGGTVFVAFAARLGKTTVCIESQKK